MLKFNYTIFCILLFDYIFYLDLDSMNNTNNNIIKSKIKISDILTADKLNNKFLFIRWPLRKSGLTYGVIKKDFQIINFEFHFNKTYIFFNYQNYTKPIACELLVAGKLQHCYRQFEEKVHKNRKIIETIASYQTDNQFKPISEKIKAGDEYDFYSPSIELDLIV